MTFQDSRYCQLLAWLETDVGCQVDFIEPASSDASFRRYFRVRIGSETQIVMDAPPPQENVKPFIHVLSLLRAAGLNTPALLAQDSEQGFLLLSDLGNVPYLSALEDNTVDRLYQDALKSLLLIQSCEPLRKAQLPIYDEALLTREVNLFEEWYLQGLLGIRLNTDEKKLLDKTCSLLVNSALEQPKTFVHRDFHARNLMVTRDANPGILDFQDAVIGPITYDLVSLLRDCYIQWPDNKVNGFRESHCQSLIGQGLINPNDADKCERWFDWMGMQRHLKAMGIFSRLKLRDGKPSYLGDIPRTFGYVLKVSEAYPELQDFADFLKNRAQPKALGGAGS